MMTKAHHYTESGLLNVYIEGIVVETDDDGDEIVTIPAINELHRTIALGIVSHAKGIAGEELRFLRTEMGLTQAELAVLVHRDKQTIGRWERNEIEIDSSAEALLRRFAIEKLELPTETGIDELSRRSVPTAEEQPIKIQRMNDDAKPYELIAA
ncbi:MAG: helix-turn-helix domain-containing protein [Mesorhizobium sp.]